jgi:hypothetical protein
MYLYFGNEKQRRLYRYHIIWNSWWFDDSFKVYFTTINQAYTKEEATTTTTTTDYW